VGFLQPRKIKDAQALLIEAMDWATRFKKPVKTIVRPKYRKPIKKVPERFFPKVIKRILDGMPDGRKRSVFILVNFLRHMGWTNEEITKRIEEWNKRNPTPLRSSYLRSQLRWHFRQDRNLLPPNIDNERFYKSMGLDSECEELRKMGIKNPVTYPFRVMKREQRLK
jgi:hypothetical protein